MLKAALCAAPFANYLGVDCCTKLEMLPTPAIRVRLMSSTTAMIKIPFPSSSFDLTSETALSSLYIVTYPPLVQGEDFEIFSLTKENSVPVEVRKHKKMYIGLRLLPGKQWVKDSASGQPPKTLYLVGAYSCVTKADLPLIDPSSNSTWSPLAHVMARKSVCPRDLKLPGASEELQTLLDTVMRDCQMPRIVHSKRLDWKRVSPLSLMSLQPPMLLVDGSDNTLDGAGKMVDAFLSAHGAMEVVWEPYSPSEPKWWVLVPRPAGMPGHLFAIMDAIQWTHPFVAEAELYKSQPLCNETLSGCVPGCPKTKIKGITGSGWGADTGHILQAYQRFFADFEPMQAGPFRLGYRYTPPLWGGTIGWLYTYQGCESNFLDCYFLDHSPCPRINMDSWNSPGVAIVDKTRFESSKPQNQGWPAKPTWWPNVMGMASPTVPEFSIGNIHSVPANHVMYSYFFRPKYDLRKIINERMAKFNLNEDCAVMHVRRGDSIMHTGQARAYLKISVYVKAGRPLMDAFGVKTVFLVTDSQGAIDEAMKCAAEHPDICGGITFRFLDKKRWVGAEGGWENPFPSGDSRTELLDIQLEFALAQKCSMAITGESNYAGKIMSHMCCGFPLSQRGQMPHRCICPPQVKLEQGGFDCKKGNAIMCDDPTKKGGDITRPLNDPSNMLGANFSLKAEAFVAAATVHLLTANEAAFIGSYNPQYNPTAVSVIQKRFTEAATEIACAKYDSGPKRRKFCK